MLKIYPFFSVNVSSPIKPSALSLVLQIIPTTKKNAIHSSSLFRTLFQLHFANFEQILDTYLEPFQIATIMLLLQSRLVAFRLSSHKSSVKFDLT